MILTHKAILNLEQFYRINLINQISGLRSPFLLSTYDKEENTNLAIFNSIVHIGSNPPCLGFILRPLTVERHSYNNIKSTGQFTLNSVNSDILDRAHQCSAKYEKGVSEYEKTKLNEYFIDTFKAPFVEESKIKIGLSYLEEHEIKYNKTRLIVGKIEVIQIEDEYIEKEGHILHQKLETILVSGLDSYYSNTFLKTLNYAKP